MMKFKYFRIFLFGILISVMLISTPATAPDPANYGGSYKTTSGDVAMYNVTKFTDINYPGYSDPYYSNSISLNNGSNFNYNVTLGTLISFTIINSTPSTIPSQSFYCTETVSSDGLNYTSASFQGVPDTTHTYLTPAFPNLSSAESYYTALDAYFTNGSGMFYSHYFVNDLYFFITNETTGNYPYYTMLSWNWKTGWENSFYAIQYLANGTIIYTYKENLINFKSQVSTTQISTTAPVISQVTSQKYSTSQGTKSQSNTKTTPGFTILSLFLISTTVFFYKKRRF